jgi:predicted GIY-YIG superfamily endonuclease
MPARAHAKKKAPKRKACATKKKKAGGKTVAKRRVNANEATFVYILQSTVEARKSYVGVTNSLPRRLRQHNGQLAGGARFTRTARPWRFHAIFATANRHDALSIEWKIKHQKRKSDGPGIEGKIAAACRFGKLVAKFAQICGPHPKLAAAS